MNFFPDTPDEQVMFSTILIKSVLPSGEISTATGFIYTYQIDDMQIPVIVTNKHVANSKMKTLHFKFHTGNFDQKQIYDEKYDLTYNKPFIIEHQLLDLSIIPIAPLLSHIKEKDNKDIFYIGLRKENVIQKEALKDLTAFEDLLMVGYPKGLYDETNYLPIFRTGKTASHPFFDFNSIGIGLSDLSVYEGSSGSPVFLYNSGAYYSKKRKTMLVGGRIELLGINSSVYTSENKGQLRVITSTQAIVQPVYNEKIDIGVYIKAHHLNDFEEQLKKLV